MKRRIGTITARLQRLGNYEYRIDFTSYTNADDSDDEADSWQWNYPISFSYDPSAGLFLNTFEIDYDTRDRFANCFWKRDSTSISKMVRQTLTIRKQKGESCPEWTVQKTCIAAENAWDRRS